MQRTVRLLIPDAPVPEIDKLIAQRELADKGLRLGFLDNRKGNADHLLSFVLDGIKDKVSLASVVKVYKERPSDAASKDVIDQLAKEADVVIMAMAD